MALLFFGVPYALLELVSRERGFRVGMLWEAAGLTATGKTWAHMWYLYLILILYAVTPALRRVLKKLPHPAVCVLLGSIALLASFLPFASELLGWGVKIGNWQQTIYVFYYCMGYVFATGLGGQDKTKEGKSKGEKRNFRGGVICLALFAVILLAEIRPDLICMLFGLYGSAAAPLACRAIRIFGLGAFFAGISILGCNYLLSRGLAFYAFWLETFRGVLFLFPATLICSRMGLENFWLLYPLTEITSFIVVLLWILLKNRITPLFVVSLPDERIFRRTVLSTSTDIGQTSVDLKDFCDQWQANIRQKYTVMLAVEEVGMTILKHGFEGVKDTTGSIPDHPSGADPHSAAPLLKRIAAKLKSWRHRSDKSSGFIQITVLALNDGTFELHLRDNAIEFNPFSLEGGYVLDSDDLDATGILMIRRRAKEFFYRRFQGFNTLIITV